MSSFWFSRIALCAVLAAPLLAQANPRYTVTAIGGPGSSAFGLNNSGQTVGYIDAGGGAYHAFLYSGGALTDLGTLGGARSNALGINDSGQVVGWADNASTFMGFIYSGGVMSAIPNTERGEAAGINNAGTVVGTDLRPDSDGNLRYQAYSYSGGVMTQLGTLPYGDSARAAAINAAGNIVGAATNTIAGAPNFPETSFLYSGGVMTDLGNFGGIWSKATSINDHGQIVGYSGTPFDPLNDDIYPKRAFLYEGGVLHDLGSLVEHTSSAAFDINNLGQIVGWSGGTTFLYEHGAMIDLNTLIDPASGWSVLGARAINDMQQIAGTACKGGACFAVRLDLVSAVPEPGTWGMLLAGCALLGLARRRARRGSTWLLAAVLAAPLVATADPLYTVKVVGTAGSAATGINSGGAVVGNFVSAGIDHAFLYSGGALTDLGSLGGSRSYASGINDSGIVVGTSYNVSGDRRAFRYASGTMADLGTLGGAYSAATAINNAGIIVGYSGTGVVDPEGGGFAFAFRYSGGSMQNLGALPDGLGSAAYGINSSGQIVGEAHQGPFTVPEYPHFAVVFDGGGITNISIGWHSSALGVNDQGGVVGWTGTPEGQSHGQYAFMYAGGVTTMLGVLDALGGSVATDINNLGRVVGLASLYDDVGNGNSQYAGTHGFIYDAGALVDLNTLIDPASGWTITEAMGINDMQQIAGTACKGGDCFAVRLDLVSAVPEPGTWGMLLAGCGLLGLVRRRGGLARR